MTIARKYMPHRRAYYPRLWPMLVPTAAVAGVLAWLFTPPWWTAIVIGLVLGSVVPQVRLVVWRRRHPVISPQDYLNDHRRAAPWN